MEDEWGRSVGFDGELSGARTGLFLRHIGLFFCDEEWVKAWWENFFYESMMFMTDGR